MMLSLQLTLDYELFGDGTGDVRREQIIPTNQLLDICELYGAKLTIYFEYGQYLAYEKYSHESAKLADDNKKIIAQLEDAIRRGHDVQFHFHPTWLNSQYNKKNGFRLCKTDFDITSFDLATIVDIMQSGKKFLEDTLKPINSDYECIAFRAGAWSASDSKKLITALILSGFKIDSTVAKGAHLKSDYGVFDFRDCSTLPYWFSSDDICFDNVSNIDSILELPILTKITNFAPFYYLNNKRKSINTIVKKYYKTKVTDQDTSKIDKIKKILDRDFILADFNFMKANVIFDMIKAEVKCHHSFKGVLPITLIGHSKTSYLNDDLHNLFRKLIDEFDLNFDTVSSFYNKKLDVKDEIVD
jgi:hypothetical protein